MSGYSGRILITGATGFAGRHLIRQLNAGRGGNRPEIFGTCFPERPEQCADLCDAERNVRLVHLDLRDADASSQAVRTIRPDQVYHLAALSQVRISWERRLEVFDTNLRGTFNLFEAVRLHSPKARVLFVSSSDVYGFLEPRRRRFRETDRGTIVSPYAFTKAAGELLAEFFANREKMPVVVARPFPHTGPGQAADFALSDWARQIALIEKHRGEDVIHAGNLDLRRDYGDVRDVVRAYVLLQRKGRPGEIYNVCTGRAPSLRNILRTLIGFSRRRIVVAVDPARIRKVDIPCLMGDNRKIREEMGWEPRIPLERTLRDLLDGWRARV